MNILTDILNLLFPRFCPSCGDRISPQEGCVCLSCMANLPRTNAHLVQGNPIEQLFWGIMPIERATSFFFYDSTDVRKIIWTFKYYSRPKVGEYLGRFYASEIKDSGFFDGIDAIIPVPLAWRKKLTRGYNQCDYIAKGISQKTGIPVISDAVKRKKYNVTQTHLDRQERQENVKDIFSLTKPEHIHGKHILIVDDVLTTGSTIASLGNVLTEAGEVRISVLTLALAGNLKGMPFK